MYDSQRALQGHTSFVHFILGCVTCVHVHKSACFTVYLAVCLTVCLAVSQLHSRLVNYTVG